MSQQELYGNMYDAVNNFYNKAVKKCSDISYHIRTVAHWLTQPQYDYVRRSRLISLLQMLEKQLIDAQKQLRVAEAYCRTFAW